jgi:hypothetical protein
VSAAGTRFASLASISTRIVAAAPIEVYSPYLRL